MLKCKCKAYGVYNANSKLECIEIERRAPRENDVIIDIKFCGICHSDLHQIRNDWSNSNYPVVPGHEIVGIVREIGANVSRHKIGDKVAVGCMVDACMKCEACLEGDEHLCFKRATFTYNSVDRIDGTTTFGGYSQSIVVREEFVLKIPDGLDMARAAPILCAGITTWSPLMRWKVGQGTKVAVVGLGGLGHMGVKLAVALGADVTVVTTSSSKLEEAKKLGAKTIIASSDASQMTQAMGQFDFILNTIPVKHDVAPYLMLLRRRGVMALVGVIDNLPSFHSGLLLSGQKSLSGSGIGGIKETQELLDFCAKNNILPETETIEISMVNHAMERMEKGDIKYRFVIDMNSLQ